MLGYLLSKVVASLGGGVSTFRARVDVALNAPSMIHDAFAWMLLSEVTSSLVWSSSVLSLIPQAEHA